MKTLNPNDLGKKHLVEEFQKVSINTFLREAKSKMKEMFLSYKIEIMDKKRNDLSHTTRAQVLRLCHVAFSFK